MAQTKRSDTILVNEFLAFVQNKLDVMDEVSLAQICTSSYTEADILAAKKYLADTAVLSIRLATRYKDGTGKKDLQDIFRVFKETDPDDVPTYVAKDLCKLPPITWDHVDTTRVLKDIMLLRADVTELRTKLEASEATVSELKTELVALRNNAAPTKMPSPASLQNVTERRYKRNNARLSTPADTYDTDTPQVNDTNDRVALMTSIIETSPLSVTSPEFVPSSRNQKKSYAQVAVQKKHHQPTEGAQKISGAKPIAKNAVDGQGFTLVKKKKPKPPTNRNKRGTATPTTGETTCLRAVEPIVQLYLSRLDPSTPGAEVVQYVKERSQKRTGVPISVVLCRLESTRPRDFKSYVLRVPAKHKDTLLDPGFWPTGVVFRRYWEARPKVLPKPSN